MLEPKVLVCDEAVAALDGSVAGATFMEQELLAFPEVATVVSKTGRAEISEDPMGPEQTDVFVMLRPRAAWDTGRDKAALVEAIRQDLTEVPGLRYSFSQPIELRVNELISGVKSDVAVKVFGPDMAVLRRLTTDIQRTLQNVPGIVTPYADPKCEHVYHLYVIQVEERDALQHHLSQAGVATGIHYPIPIHVQPAY